MPLEVKKGSLILLHGLLPHRSFENRSSHSRHAYTLHLIGADAKYPVTIGYNDRDDAVKSFLKGTYQMNFDLFRVFLCG